MASDGKRDSMAGLPRRLPTVAARLAALAVAGVSLAVAGAAIAADPTGLWQTPVKGGQVRIEPCGGALCGTLVTSDMIRSQPGLKDARNKDPALRGRTLKGLQLFRGLKGGPPAWSGGSIYNPDDGKTYSAKLKMTDDRTLQVSGCIGPLCRPQTWKRIN